MKSSITNHQGDTNQNPMSHHLTSVRMATTKNTGDNKYWQGCGEEGLLITAGRDVNWCNHYGKQYRSPQKIKNRNTMIQLFYSWVFIKRKQNTNLKRYTHLFVRCSILSNKQDMEANFVVHQWMNG